MSTLIYNPDRPHSCVLLADAEFSAADLRRGAVEVCNECGKAWVYDPIPWERDYRSLRPWPFDRKQRRAVKEARS